MPSSKSYTNGIYREKHYSERTVFPNIYGKVYVLMKSCDNMQWIKKYSVDQNTASIFHNQLLGFLNLTFLFPVILQKHIV